MTKSRTLRRAGAVALSLAMAMSIVGVTPASAAAKKVTLSKAKGTIKVGKTATVKIKGTKKANIKKVTFKYSKKNIVKATWKKKTPLKFTVKGLKKGTSTVKATIQLKKKVGSKKKYTLKYVATVKKAATPTTAPEATATPSELKLDSVEGAQRDAWGETNVIVAYFSAAVADFAATDVEIRKVSDNKLYTVEKVVASSDKKTATLTLTGTSSAGTAGNTEFLSSNVEYKLIVKAGGKVYEKVFVLPAIADEYVVSSVNKKDKKITLAGSGEYTIGDGVTVDYQEILGRTVTAQYDRNSVISSLKVIDEKVVYGAFKAVDTDNDAAKDIDALQDIKSETKYSIVKTGIDGPGRPKAAKSNIYVTGETNLDANTSVLAKTNNTVQYGKVVLNGDGTVRWVVTMTDFDEAVWVGSIKDTDIVEVNGKTTHPLKDYTVIKGGKQIEISELVAGDIVYIDKEKKYAIAYNDDKDTGKLKLYTGKFEVNAKKYEYDSTYAKAPFSIVADKKDEAATDANAKLKPYVDSDVTLFFNWAGKPQKVAAGDVTASTSTITGVIIDGAKLYTSGSSHLIDVSVDAGEGKKAYTIDVAKLTNVTDRFNKKVSVDGTTVKGITVKTGTYNAAKFDGVLTANGDAGLNLAVGEEMATGDLITLTAKTDGTITGIELAGNTGGATPTIHEDAYISTNAIGGTGADAGDDHVNLKGIKGTTGATAGNYDVPRITGHTKYVNRLGDTALTFKKGGNQVQENAAGTGFIVGSTTPVYLYNSEAKTVKKITYSEVDFSFGVDAKVGTAQHTTATDVPKVNKPEGVVRFAGDTVSCIVIDMVNAGIASTSTKTIAAVLIDYTLDKSSTKKFSEVTYAYNGEKITKTAADFANDVTVTSKKSDGTRGAGKGTAAIEADFFNDASTPKNVAIGEVAFISLDKDEKVTAISLQNGEQAAINPFTFDRDNYGIDPAKKLVTAYDSSIPATICKLSKDGKTCTPISWRDLTDLQADGSKITTLWGVNYSGNYYDVLVAQFDSKDEVAAATNKTKATADLAALTVAKNGAGDAVEGLESEGATNKSAITWEVFYKEGVTAQGTINVAGKKFTGTTGTGSVMLKATATLGGQSDSAYFYVPVSTGTYGVVANKTATNADNYKKLFSTTTTATYTSRSAGDVNLSPELVGDTGFTLAFTSSDTNKATVADTGVVTAQATGQTTITATASLDGFTKDVTVVGGTIMVGGTVGSGTTTFTCQ